MNKALGFLRSAKVEVYEGEYPATPGNSKGRWYFRSPGRMRKPSGDGHGTKAEAARAAIEEMVLDGKKGEMEKPKYVILYKGARSITSLRDESDGDQVGVNWKTG